MFKNCTAVSHFRLGAITIVFISVVLTLSACSPKKTAKVEPVKNGDSRADADKNVTQEELTGLWLVESIEDNKKNIFKFEKEILIATEEVQSFFGIQISTNSKAVLALKIEPSLLHTMTYAEGVEKKALSDPLVFENGTMKIENSENRSLAPRIIVPKRIGSNYFLLEKSWQIKIRKVSDYDLAELLKSHLQKNEIVNLPITPKAPPAINLTPLQEAGNQLIKSHEQNFNQRIMQEFDKRVAQLEVGELSKIKEQLERAISKSEIIYDSAARNIGNILYNNKIQCYSGTSILVATILKKVTPEKWNALNLVVIHTSGHVLPGYLINESGKYRLFGIEMTSSDDGIVDFGYTDQVKIPMRVADALSWANIESNPKKSEASVVAKANQIISQTHSRFEIPLNPIPNTKLHAETGNSPFAFGSPPPPQVKPRSIKTKAETYNLNRDSNQFLFETVHLAPAPLANFASSIEKSFAKTVGCDLAVSYLTGAIWDSMEIDLSENYKNENDRLNYQDQSEAKSLYNTITMPRSKIEFFTGKDKSLIYYSYDGSDGKRVTKAFRILKDTADFCTIGIGKGMPQELNDFADGTVQISIDTREIKIGDKIGYTKLPFIWKNNSLEQIGSLYLDIY